MNCCPNCFNDWEVIGFIKSNSTELGVCDYCHSKDTNLLDCRDLEEFFQPLISVFRSVEVTTTGQKFLHEKIQETWMTFKSEDSQVNKRILVSIISGTVSEGDPILTCPVEIGVLSTKGNLSEVHEKKWTSFGEEIKFKNRFFLNEIVDLELLKNLFRNFSKTYNKGKIFYRARISSKTGYPIAEMGKPPIDKSTAGRANPYGIPYLYLSTKIETTIYESRSSYLDYITVGQFKLIESIKVVSLREIATISPFVFGDHLENYIVHQRYLSRLERELSKPVRRFDKELDYLPSQYLCEYVKSLGYDAIEYGSSLYQGGINIAVFNDHKLHCRRTEVYEILSVELGFKQV